LLLWRNEKSVIDFLLKPSAARKAFFCAYRTYSASKEASIGPDLRGANSLLVPKKLLLRREEFACLFENKIIQKKHKNKLS
jgi:hypothetical protein